MLYEQLLNRREDWQEELLFVLFLPLPSPRAEVVLESLCVRSSPALCSPDYPHSMHIGRETWTQW